MSKNIKMHDNIEEKYSEADAENSALGLEIKLTRKFSISNINWL